MHLKTIILSAIAAVGIGNKAHAQDMFNEMEYTPMATVFHLNSPTKALDPTTLTYTNVDGVTGASLQEGSTWQPQVFIRIYDKGLGGKPVKTVRMKKDGDNRWTATVKGDLKGKFYTFDAGYGETPGVFAKAVGVNGKRAAIIVDSEKVAPLIDPSVSSSVSLVSPSASLVSPSASLVSLSASLVSPSDLSVTSSDALVSPSASLVSLSDPSSANHKVQSSNFKVQSNKHQTSNFKLQTIYELHFRDFSISRPDAKYPGKFLALTEPWAIEHLKRLGVSAVHILPSFDFGSVDETKLDVPQYNWGYDPVNYNVPEGSYSTDPYNPATRIHEFKQMVSALHKAGIRVILDVVYNHTFDLKNSNFQKTWPNYYYRFTNLKPSNGSGCGNETASEKPLMREFMIESVKYWAQEYGIDGFRFDLMGVHDIETMNAIRAELNKINPHIFIYGEGWSAGQCAYPTEKLAVKANMKQMPGIAAFCDDLRDALRGPFSDDTKGAFLLGIPGSEESIKAGIVGMIAHPQVDYSKVNYSKEPWALEPTQCINYVSCHDDMCLIDRLRTELNALADTSSSASPSTDASASALATTASSTASPATTSASAAATTVSTSAAATTASANHKLQSSNFKVQSKNLSLLAQTAVFTSQGVPFMLSGEEMLRDKKGVHNSYNSPDSVNELPWANVQCYPQVFEYYSRLIALRNHHPAFRLGSADLVRKHLAFLDCPSSCLVGYIIRGNAGGDAWKDIIVLFNSNKEAKDVTIPDGTYTVVCRDGKIDEQGIATVSGSTVTVPAQSALILHD